MYLCAAFCYINMYQFTQIIKILAFACCAVFVFLIPFDWQSGNYILGSFALFAVVNPELWKNIKTTRLSFAEKALLLVTATYLLWELVSMLWTYNTDRGLTVITRHLPLFAMPCLMVLGKIGGVIKRPGTILQIFCLGVLVSMVMCLILSYYDSLHEVNGEMVFDHRLQGYRDRGTFDTISCGYSYFSYTQLSHFENPHYIATFVNVVIMTAYANFYECKFKLLPSILLSLLVVFCSVFLFMLCNRANYLIFIIMLVIVAVYEFFVKKHRIVGVVALVGMVSLSVVMFTSGRGNDIVSKVKSFVMNDINDEDADISKEEKMQKINGRAITWDSSTHLIAKHPVLGSGVGDTREALIGQYYIDGFIDTAYEGFNSHNQYLDTWIGVGIVGVLLLLCLLVLPVIAGFKYGYLPLILYDMALIVGFVTEVMFTHSIGDFTITLVMMLMIMSAIEQFNKTKSSTIPVERT